MKQTFFISGLVCFAFFLSTCKKEEIQTKMKVKTANITDITASSAIITCNILDGEDEMTEYGIIVHTGKNVSEGNKYRVTKNQIGIFFYKPNQLTPLTTYYVCAYSTNGKTTVYGEVKSFTTKDGSIRFTEFTNTNIYSSSFRANSTYHVPLGVGIIKNGFCYKKDEEPGVDDNPILAESLGNTISCEIDNLQPSTSYHVRSFVISKFDTTLSKSLIVKTPSGIVKMKMRIYDATYSSLNLSLAILERNGAYIYGCGICYSFVDTPTVESGTLTRLTTSPVIDTKDSYYYKISNLPRGKKIYFRPYYKIKSALIYGETVRTNPKRNIFEPEMVFVQGGTFTMGSDTGWQYEKPAHEVTVSDFYIGKYAVTIQQFIGFLNEANFSSSKICESGAINDENFPKGFAYPYNSEYRFRNQPFANTDKCPVYFIKKYGMTAFCNWLSSTTGKKYRLPTEAEWEYAAKGGNKSKGYKYAGADDLNEVAWYSDNSNELHHRIGLKVPNELGISDMAGGVWEATMDGYAEYSPEAQTNPLVAGNDPVIRGGSIKTPENQLHPTFRRSWSSMGGDTSPLIGFRVVREID